MTVLAGDLRRAPLAASSPELSNDLDSAAGVFLPLHASSVERGLSKAVTPHLPVSMSPRTIAGDVRRSYFNDFYFRIHYTPTQLAFGDILSDVDRPISVWNAYFQAKTIESIADPTELGVTIVPPPGVSIPQIEAPLREIFFTAHATRAGAPLINSNVVFTVDGEAQSVATTGRRLVVFPFPPNWSTPFDETFQFDSWVLEAANGAEQTGSGWGADARHQFDFTIMVKGLQMQRLENMLFAWQNRIFGLPHWAEKSKLSVEVSPGDTAISLDTTNRSFEPGKNAVIYRDADNYEAFQIADMTEAGLVPASPMLQSWPVGSRVYPMYAGMLTPQVSGSHQVDNVITMPVSFDCEPNQSPVNTLADPAPIEYRGEELYLGRLNWKDALSFSYASDRMQVDYKTGLVRTYSPSGFSKSTRKHNWQMKTRAEARAFRAWLARREGVARPVYMPTGKTDLTLAADIISGSQVITVLESDYAAFAGGAPARRDIIILLKTGSYLLRRVESASSMADGTQRLTLDSPVVSTILPSQVKRISFLNLYRMNSNLATVRWLTDEVGISETDLRVKIAP